VFDGINQGVQGDRKAYLGGLLKDVFLDSKRAASNPVTPDMIDQTLAMAMLASPVATAACVDAFAKTDFRRELAAVEGADTGPAWDGRYPGAAGAGQGDSRGHRAGEADRIR